MKVAVFGAGTMGSGCADRIHAIVQAKECLLGNNLKFIEATKKELEQL